MNRVLVFGENGMAGHMVSDYLACHGYDMYTTSREKNLDKQNHFVFDVENDRLDHLLRTVKPDVVINCIGVLTKAAEEHHSSALLVNSWFPHVLNEKSREYRYRLIHISTDCVFSGYRGDYIESDFPDETSFYGRTKALGELRNQSNLTIRTSIIGPEIRGSRVGLLDWFLKQNGTINGYTHVMWTGVTTLQLAKSIEKILDTNLSGLIHLVNGKKISKYDLLLLFQKYFSQDVVIKPFDDFVSDKSLINTRNDIPANVPDYDEMIRELFDWMKDSQKYNEYFR